MPTGHNVQYFLPDYEVEKEGDVFYMNARFNFSIMMNCISN